MVAYQFRMPVGIPGEVNRVSAATIEAQVVTPSGTTGAPTEYGVPMVVDNTGGNVGNMRTVAASDTAAPYGLLVRPFPTGGSQDPLGTSTPPTAGLVDILVRGYMLVKLGGNTAAVKGGTAYVWNAATSTTHIQGHFEATFSSGNTLTCPGSSYFTGPADATGIVEVAFNI
jgi:hypothetical protein